MVSPLLSVRAMTNCLMFLLKHNELAEQFVDKRGFVIMKNLLQKQCLSNDHVAYNVSCCLWIMSYHKFALPLFADF